MKSLYRKFEGRGRDSLLHRNLRVCTEEGVFATPYVIISTPGNMIIAALLTSLMGIGESLYGWIVSLPAWANAVQVFLLPMLSRRFSARAMSLGFSIVNLIVWTSLVLLLRRLPLEDPDLIGRLMLLYFVAISMSQSLAAVSWMTWVQEWIPERLRGKYFGNRNRAMGLITVTCILAVGWVFSEFGESLLAFEIILGVTGLVRLLSIYLMSHIYTPWSRPEPVASGTTLRFGELLARGSVYRSYLWFGGILAFSLSLTGPFYPVYMSQHLQFHVYAQTHLLILANLTSAITMPFWGRLCDRYGCRPIITLCALAWMLQNYLWIILNPSLTWMLYGMWAWGGAVSSGVILGAFNLVLKLTPKHLKSTGVSLHLAATSVAAATAPVLAGWLITTELLPIASEVARYRLLFLIQPSMVILALLLLARVREPKAAELTSLTGGFGTMRQILLQNGIVLLINSTLMRRFRRGKD